MSDGCIGKFSPHFFIAGVEFCRFPIGKISIFIRSGISYVWPTCRTNYRSCIIYLPIGRKSYATRGIIWIAYEVRVGVRNIRKEIICILHSSRDMKTICLFSVLQKEYNFKGVHFIPHVPTKIGGIHLICIAFFCREFVCLPLKGDLIGNLLIVDSINRRKIVPYKNILYSSYILCYVIIGELLKYVIQRKSYLSLVLSCVRNSSCAIIYVISSHQFYRCRAVNGFYYSKIEMLEISCNINIVYFKNNSSIYRIVEIRSGDIRICNRCRVGDRVIGRVPIS